MRNSLLLGLLVAVIVLGVDRRDQIKKTVIDYMTPRGIRNNNPGNLRHSGTSWRGMSAQQTDVHFVQFETPEYGIRALGKLLDTYYTRYGLNTVRGIISRYAPSTENDTAAYVETVAKKLSVRPDDVINVIGKKQKLIEAIIEHENGQQPYTVAQIAGGISMA